MTYSESHRISIEQEHLPQSRETLSTDRSSEIFRVLEGTDRVSQATVRVPLAIVFGSPRWNSDECPQAGFDSGAQCREVTQCQ